MDKQLLPCPFCGGEARIKTRYIGFGSIGLGEHDLFCVECNGCKARTGEYRDKQAAIAAWSRRAQPASEPLTLEELRKMDGKPVYTKTIGVVGSGRWELPHSDDHWLYLRTACEDYKMTFAELEHSYGKTWLAYRQRPESEVVHDEL